MMAYQRRVNQFRSRIDFDDPSTTKPQSLAKSAVLQALEDEEREQSRAGKGLKRVAWPPPAELGDDYQQQQPAQQQQQQPYHYPPQQQQHQQQPTQQQSHQFYPQQQQQQQQQQHYQQPHTQQHQPRERIIPIQRPEPSTQQPQYQPQPTQAFQPLVSQQQQQQQQQQFYQPPEAIPQHHQQPQQQPASVADSQIPFFTTLRKEAPMSQEPTPVYHTEPVAAIYQGGTNMRGDEKWPPAEVKKQSELENEERLKLAQQPAFRPRKVQKDYSDFFAKNALNATYPGYRAPPGTQHHS